MTLVLTTNVVGQPRGESVRLAPRRRRLSTVVARHRPPAGRRFLVSVHRRGEPGEVYAPSDRTVRLRAAWPKTLVGGDDVVVFTLLPLGSTGTQIGLALAAIALTAVAGPAGAAFGATVGAAIGTSAAVGAFVVQAGMVVGGLALGYAAQASKAAAKKANGDLYTVQGGGNVPKPGARKPLLYGRRWTAPPLSQADYYTIDGDANVLTKRMTLGLGKFQIHRIRVGDALFWTEAGGIQAPFNAATGPQGAAVEVLYEKPSALVPGDIIPSPAVGGQELPRPGGNPDRTPWYRLAPQGVSVDAAQFNWTYPAIYRVSSSGKSGGAPAGVVFFGREIDPNTGAVLGPEVELWRSQEPNDAYIRTPLRRNAYFRLPKSGAYEVSAQNLYPAPLPGVEVENRVIWDGMFAFEDDTRIRPNTTEIVLRVRAGKGLTVTAFGDITVEATRILPVWDGTEWTEQPTRKAVWAYCDLVRSAYGLDAPDGVDADKALYYADLLTANDTYDGQLPEVSSFWEAASEVLHPLRADPVKVGAVHSFVRDEVRAEPRHVLTRRQIVRDSSGASYSTKVEGGDVIVEFDRDGDPRRPDEARFSYGPPTRTPKRYRVAGITDGLHALKHATWLAAVAVFRGVERKVTTEWDGRLVYPGDHILSDLWFLKGKQAYGVAGRTGTVLTLDVTANVPSEWGYGSVRTRVGREWGILRMRGVGARGLELHPDDVAALEARTGLGLADVLTREGQDPTTIVLGDLVELQETYVARAALPSDADHVQIEMVQDDPRVWQLLDEAVIAPAPVDADALAEPLVPTISVLHARCVRIETGIEVVWGVSATRGARNYEADLSYDAGATWESLSPFGPESSGRASMRQIDGPVTVRARAYGRTGLPGAWIATTFTTVAPVVAGALVDISTLPLLGYANLDETVTRQIDRLDGIQHKAEDAAAAAEAAYQQALSSAAAALEGALARIDTLRKSLARDPAVRQGIIDPIIADFRADVDLLTQSVTRNLQEVSALRDALTTAGLELIPSEGRVRFYAIEALQSSVGTTISNFSVTVDALSKKIDLYGSVQTGDLSGLITSITTVQATLNALQGTITNSVSAAQFNPVVARVSTAETRLDAQAATIETKASLIAVDAQGVRLGTAEQRISASEGRIFQAVQASAGSQFDLALLPQTLSGFFDFIQRQQGALSQTIAVATENLAANIDASGRSTAELRTDLLVFSGEASAQFTSLTRAIADTRSSVVSVQTVLSARIGAAEANLSSEVTARTTADAASTVRIDGALSRLGTAEAALVSEATTRATADAAATSRIDGALSRIGAAEASLVSEATTRATADEAATSQIQAAVSRLGAAEASIVSEASMRAAADSAAAIKVDGLSARVGSAEAGINSLSTAQANDRSSNASQFQGVTARFGTVENRASSLEGRAAATEASIAQVSQAYAAADQALGSRIDTVTARVGSNEAAVASEVSTRATQYDSLASSINQVNAKADAANAGVSNEASARASGDAANASSVQDLYARSDIGTAAGRFAMTAVAAPGGVSVRLAAQVSTDSYGQRRNAGWYLDLLPDGQSRFIVDANTFAITANGGVTYPLVFDGSILTIPILRVTSQAFLPNAVSQTELRISGDTSVSVTLNTRPNARVIVTATFDGKPTVALPVNGAGVLRIARDGTALRDAAVSFYIAGNNDNRGAFTLQTTSLWEDRPSPGNHTYTVSTTNGQGGVTILVQELTA